MTDTTVRTYYEALHPDTYNQGGQIDVAAQVLPRCCDHHPQQPNLVVVCAPHGRFVLGPDQARALAAALTAAAASADTVGGML